jgi:hypothetical protein
VNIKTSEENYRRKAEYPPEDALESLASDCGAVPPPGLSPMRVLARPPSPQKVVARYEGVKSCQPRGAAASR